MPGLDQRFALSQQWTKQRDESLPTTLVLQLWSVLYRERLLDDFACLSLRTLPDSALPHAFASKEHDGPAMLEFLSEMLQATKEAGTSFQQRLVLDQLFLSASPVRKGDS